MRIAFILSSAGNFGPFIVARDIIDGIKGKVDQIDIFYLKQTEQPLDFSADSIKKIDFFDKIDLSTYDIIHSHGFLADAYVYYRGGGISGRTVSTMHQNIKPDYSMNYNPIIGSVLEKIWCFLLRRTDKIVCLSNDMVSYYSKIFNDKSLTYIHNGISPLPHEKTLENDQMSIIKSLRIDHVVLGVSARLIFRKGIDIIIDAINLSSNKKIILLIIGDGEKKEELIAQAKVLDVIDRCFFVGYQKDVIPYYELMDFYIMSSRSEAFGLCILEAASLKIPVICCDLPIYRELFGDTDVIRFEVGSSMSLSNAINIAIPQRNQLSLNIYKKYLDNFTLQIMADRYLALYNRLIGTSKI